MGFAKLLIAWPLSLLVFALAIHLWNRLAGRSGGGFLETLTGMGLLLAFPSMLFTLILGWPAAYTLSGVRPAFVIPLLLAGLLALAMRLLTRIFLRNGWAGAEDTLVIYAATLGLVLGGVQLGVG